ncbi:MAG: sulfite exporter TauE/SafE family protein, partial [Terracidiphilus sp.]
MLIPAAHPLVHWQLLWLVLAAFFGGVLNAVAGGGSFLLFPAMLGTGMLPVHANATNTVALWPGQLTSIAAYRDDMRRHLRLAVLMGVAGLIGGTAGALVLLSTPQRTFMALVPWLLLVAATIFALSRPATRWLEGRKAARHARAGTAPGPHRPHRLGVFLSSIVV